MTGLTLITLIASVSFLQPFAPSEGHVNPTEREFRSEICLNGYWDISFHEGKWEDVKIKIPSPWNVNDFAFPGCSRNLLTNKPVPSLL